jgi:hypothetical protein
MAIEMIIVFILNFEFLFEHKSFTFVLSMKIHSTPKPARSDKDLTGFVGMFPIGNYCSKITIEKIKNLNFGNKTNDE